MSVHVYMTTKWFRPGVPKLFASPSPRTWPCRDGNFWVRLNTSFKTDSSLAEKQNEILFLEEEVRSLRIKLTKRDADLMKQERELNKLRVRTACKEIPNNQEANKKLGFNTIIKLTLYVHVVISKK